MQQGSISLQGISIDCLNSAKYFTITSAFDTLESAHPQVRQTFSRGMQEHQSMADDWFRLMQRRGWYTVPDARPEISSEMSSFIQSLETKMSLQPPYGMQTSGQSTFGQSSFSQPPYGQAAYGQPIYGQTSWTQQPTYGASWTQQPTYGAPWTQQPTYGASWTQQPTYGGASFTQHPSQGQASWTEQPIHGVASWAQPAVHGQWAESYGRSTFNQPSRGMGWGHPSAYGQHAYTQPAFGNQAKFGQYGQQTVAQQGFQGSSSGMAGEEYQK